MRVSVFGMGYVGTVTAACLARDGHQVIGVDVSQLKVDALNAGRSPVVEPGLPELIAEMAAAGRLRATLDSAEAVQHSELSLICVGTPSAANGSLDLRHVEQVCREIGARLAEKREPHTVVVRSTVLPGTVDERLIPVLEQSSGRRVGETLGVAMNPEFLRESSALADYDQPSLVVIGQFDPRSGDAVQALYEKIDAPVVRTSLRTAEMVKYVNNAFHALKIVFANEIGGVCKAHGIDGREVMEIFCQDRRLNISPAYLRPGFAFGGSCLPKDVRALVHQAVARDVECPMLSAVIPSNQRQVARGVEMVERTRRKRVGVLGLSFKAGTDDVRESAAVPLIETLIGRGYQVCVYDDTVRPECLIGANRSFLERELPHIASLMRPTLEEVIKQSDVLVIAHNAPAFCRVRQLTRADQIVVDLVGMSRASMEEGKGEYDGIAW